MLDHLLTTTQPQSVGLLFALVSIHAFETCTAYIGPAYLQASEPFVCEVFMKNSVAGFELSPDQCFNLHRSLYVLCGAGHIWDTKLDKYHRIDLGMTPFHSNPNLLYLLIDGNVEETSGSHVDDLKTCIYRMFWHFLGNQAKESKWEKRLNFLLRLHISSWTKSEGRGFNIDENNYIRRLKVIPLDASFRNLRAVVSLLNFTARAKNWRKNERSRKNLGSKIE